MQHTRPAPAIARGPQLPVSYRTVRDQVLGHASSSPDAVAIADSGSQLTYAELARTSGDIAAWLCHHAPPDGVVRPIVGVVGGRSSRLVAALLAAWRAGAAYLPIASDYPLERVRYLIDDARPSALLVDEDTTPQSLLDELSSRADVVTIAQAEQVGADLSQDLVDATAPMRHELAYVIYTSGSTGKPKGAMVSHANLVNFVAAHRHDFALTPADRQGWAGNVSFDASASDIWPTLASGATLCVAPSDVAESVTAFVGWLRRDRVTMVLIATALINILFGRNDRWWEGTRLRSVVTGGDRLTRRPPRDLPFRFVNAYGPTECTIWTTLADVGPMPPEGRGIAPTIGTPITNTSVVILDERGHVCAVGDEGELCLGGAGVGLGYLNRPELTSERYLPDDFVGGYGIGTVYRTGDTGVMEEDGAIRFVGRADRQIAIQGFRVEAGEVESAVLADEAISEAVVKRIDRERLGPRLVAFVTAAEGASVSPEGLRESLQRSLPRYMVPSEIVVLAEMPKTPTGKVDEAALTPPPRDRDAIAGEFVAPATELEASVCDAFANVLDLDSVGVLDDFFELGGDSLSTVELASVFEEMHGIELPEGAMSTASTPRELAGLLGGGEAGGGPTSVDWTAEVKATFTPAPASAGDPARPTYLVTGASGFVGSFVVEALLERDDARVVTVNRVVSDDTSEHDGVRSIAGDLAQPDLGLSDDERERLRRDGLAGVAHLAAEVNDLKSYRGLKRTNVEGTTALAQLALEMGAPAFAFASTLAAAGDEPPMNGYAASKWVAERRLDVARSVGLSAQSMRFGRILPDRAGTAWNPKDTMMLVLRACRAIGAYPPWSIVDYGTPADIVARAFATVAAGGTGSDAPILFPPLLAFSYRSLAERLSSLGPTLSLVDYDEWLEALDASTFPERVQVAGLLAIYPRSELVGDVPDSVEVPEELQPVVEVSDGAVDADYVDRMLDAATADLVSVHS